MSRTSNEFEIKLSELVKVGIPPLQALTCLEANEATAGDVYLFWHAMIWAIKDVVDDSEFPAGVREQILGILNSICGFFFAKNCSHSTAEPSRLPLLIKG